MKISPARSETRRTSGLVAKTAGPSSFFSHPNPVSLRTRIGQSSPLFLAGAAFLAGAWAASADHVRVLASPYPLWILLALNGAIIAIAGTAGVFVKESDRLMDDDPEIVRVPRLQWEALVRRLEQMRRATESALLVVDEPAPPQPVELMPAPIDARPAEIPPLSPGPPEPMVELPSPLVEVTALRREMGLLELQGIAAAAVTTGEKLGGEELNALLEGSAVDLAHISELLGAPRKRNEAPSALLIRLLRLSPKTGAVRPEGFTVADTEWLAEKLGAMILAPNPPRTPEGSSEDLGTAAEEFDALLRELAPEREPPKRAGAPTKRAKVPPPPPDPYS